MLTGERAALGALHRDHLPSFARWINDPEVRRGLAYRGLANEDAERKWYEEMTEAGRAPRPSAVVFAVHDAADGELVGVCGIEGIDHHFSRAELGIFLGRRRGTVYMMGRRWDSLLMDATAADFESPVLGRLQP